MGEVRGARAAFTPRYARTRSSGTRAPPPARRVSALLRSRDGGVRRANLARGLSPSASRRATLTRPPTFRADHSSTPDCPRSCGGSARCARARTSSRASATNPRVARRRRRPSSPTSSRATRGKPCVRRVSEDAMSFRCVSDFAAIPTKTNERSPRRRHPRRPAPEYPLVRALPRAPRRLWTSVFSRSVAENTRFRSFSVFRRCFFVGVSCLARPMRKGFAASTRAGIHAMRRARVPVGRAGAAKRRQKRIRSGLRVRARSRGPDATHARLDRPHLFGFVVGAPRPRPRERLRFGVPPREG